MLVTLEEAKQHLRVDTNHLDDDILFKLEQVSFMCIDFVKHEHGAYEDSAGQPLNVPPYLQAACLVWLGILFRFRDSDTHTGSDFGFIPREVSNILWPYRKPSYA